MFGRYRRLVPWWHRRLIAAYGLPKPNWFVGSAEAPVFMDEQMEREIAELKAALQRRHDALREEDQT